MTPEPFHTDKIVYEKYNKDVLKSSVVQQVNEHYSWLVFCSGIRIKE